MSNPIEDWLESEVKKRDTRGAPAEPHRELVNGILGFLLTDMAYVLKFGDESLIRRLGEWLEGDK